MPQLILLSVPNVVAQNVVAALPARAALVSASGVVETSLDGTTFTALSAGANTAAPFIRPTGAGNTIIFAKPIA